MQMIVAGHAKLVDDSLSAPQYLILQMLVRQGPMISTNFVSILDVTPAAITNLTNKLVQKGYIERLPSTLDRRQTYLQATRQGHEAENKLRVRYKQLTQGLWDDLSEQETDLLLSVYGKMVQRLQERLNFKLEYMLKEEKLATDKSDYEDHL
ncbi:MarR family transcriptional regulator [Paenibacillus shenyangensis]|uniref:MarR family transcriptional regulator n=1 Tax=Paenibacillus sp. A9 TaxID=1284352 RepID=UPI000AD2BDE6|nr:MarR family transcriptional regulator [Paenibacillus sp. A9]